ncbi:antiterminator LoaP [Clostridiisalibacter paucivorans]|uniref:antiterminator LoaP n=1 Tax=Clostridiisalibacter paucivorans TaxID=408753 RepID=UPI00047B2032|nr:antiterminator LoaP [Clostridiisalibacter paucivorans]
MWVTENCWHAIFVFTGQEEKVKKALENTFGNQIKCIVPKRELRERKSGKWHKVKRKLFPGYVLIKGDIDVEKYYKIKEIPILTKLLKDRDGPLRIEEKELKVLNILITNDDGNIGISKLYKENEEVRVINGPLVGLEGYIQSIDARKGRAKVKIDFLGDSRIVQLGIDFVDKI